MGENFVLGFWHPSKWALVPWISNEIITLESVNANIFLDFLLFHPMQIHHEWRRTFPFYILFWNSVLLFKLSKLFTGWLGYFKKIITCWHKIIYYWLYDHCEMENNGKIVESMVHLLWNQENSQLNKTIF